MPNIYKMSNVGGFKTLTHYPDMLAGNTVWNPYSPTGAYDALATVTVGTAVSSVTFSGIPSTYTHLQIRGICSIGTGNDLLLQYNTDSTGTNYYYHRLIGDGSSASSAAGNIRRILDSGGNGSTSFQGFVIDILDYANVNKNTTIRALSGYDANGSGNIALTSNLWNNTSAINQIILSGDTANILQYSTFSLYGGK